MGMKIASKPRAPLVPVGRKRCDDPRIDYKDIVYLAKFMTPQAQLQSRRRTSFCAQCQRQLKQSVKRARFMGLLPFVG
jgi:ribosomal protein S18